MGPILVAGVALSAFSKLAGASASIKAYGQQEIAARIAALRRRLKADDDARDIENQGARFAARQAVGFAKSGVMLDSGSPLQTLVDTAVRVERNALRVHLQGEYDAGALDATASAYDVMGKSAAISGVAGATGSFLSGLAMSEGMYKPGARVKEEPWMKEYGND